MHPPPVASLALVSSFVLLTVAAIAIVAAVTHRTLGTRRTAQFGVLAAMYVVMTGWAAAAGALAHFDLPPRLFLIFLPALAGMVVLVLSDTGRRLSRAPWSWLIGAQVFRVGVELAIHRAVVEGVAPPQMTWTGYNFDMAPAVLALPVAVWAARGAPRAALWAFNILGVLTLAGVVATGILSMPTPFQQFRPDNTWIAWPPFVWLPTVLVMVALLLHGLSFRKLVESRPAARGAASGTRREVDGIA